MGATRGSGWRAPLSRCCAWLLAAVLLPALAGEPPTIALTTGETHDQTTLVIDRIMTQAYARIGYALQVVRLPLRRGLAQANAGNYDGELYRVLAITEEFPNLKPVPTPIGAVEFYAFALRPLQLAGWASLAPYRLGGEMGIKHVEYNTRGMQISFTAKPEQLLLMLEAGRIEVAILEKNSARLALHELRARGQLPAGLHALGLIDQVPLHSFLHHKHAALLPKVDQALRELTAEGLIHRAWAESDASAEPELP